MPDLDRLKEAAERAVLLQSSMAEDYYSLLIHVAEWAEESWEGLIQEVLQQQPEKVLALGRDRIRALKLEVEEFISSQPYDVVREALRGGWVIHEWSIAAAADRLSAQELRSLGGRVGDAATAEWADEVKAAFHSVYVAVLPVLREAGLDDPALPTPAQIFEAVPLYPDATESLACYAGGARVFGEALLVLKVALEEQRRTDAQALWDEA